MRSGLGLVGSFRLCDNLAPKLLVSEFRVDIGLCAKLLVYPSQIPSILVVLVHCQRNCKGRGNLPCFLLQHIG